MEAATKKEKERAAEKKAARKAARGKKRAEDDVEVQAAMRGDGSAASKARSKQQRGGKTAETANNVSRPQSSGSAERSNALWEVFRAFDLDKNGTIESSELMQLGQVQRGAAGWSKADNDKLVEQMQGDISGKVSGDNFVEHLGSSLQGLESKEFNETINKFKLLASKNLQIAHPSMS